LATRKSLKKRICDEKDERQPDLMQQVMVLIVAALLLIFPYPAKAETLYVGPGEVYNTIQAAIDDAGSGDTISVAPGLYSEAITVDKHIVLQGAGNSPMGTVIAPSGNIGISAITVNTGGISETNPLIIKNILVTGQNNSDANGIEFTGNLDISHITLDSVTSKYNDFHGLTLNIAKPNSINDLVIANCDFSSNARNGMDCPAYLSLANVAITNTSMNDNGDIGAWFGAELTNLIVSGGTYNSNGTASEWGQGLLIEGNTSDVQIKNAEFNANGRIGIEICGYSELITNVTIDNVTVANNERGMLFWYDTGLIDAVVITDSTIAESASHGIHLTKCQESSTGSINDLLVEDARIINNYANGIQNDLCINVLAEYNWWGDDTGPNHPENPTGSGDGVSDNVDYEPWLDADPGINILKLNVQSDPAYLQPSNSVVIDMDALSLVQNVVGCQAVLNFNSDYFLAGQGEVDVQPGGGIWDELIWDQWTLDGDMDVAVGVDLESVVGTKADGTVAKFTLTVDSNAHDGTTQMIFRPDIDDIESTVFADQYAQAVLPGKKIDSQTIVIDGTDPNITALTARQDHAEVTVDVLNCANTALQGTVVITVDADDVLAGLAQVPAININGPENLTPILVDSEGPTYAWNLEIDENTDNGTYNITITATDNAGNEQSVTGDICVNKNEIAGTMAMDTWNVAIYSFERDVVFKATDSAGSVLKEWTVTVEFTNNNSNAFASASYNLKDIPSSTANLSAKTDWTLRRKIPVSFDSNTQAIADFTGGCNLLGGDLNGSNTTQFLDFLVLRNNWFTHEAIADINGDGNVQFSDFLILRQNWFMTGDDE